MSFTCRQSGHRATTGPWHPSRPRTLLTAAMLGAAALLLAACSSSSSSSSTTSGGSSTTASTTCSPAALSGRTSPVTITFWESMPRANGQTLQALTNAFNSSQTKVHVNLVVQTSYNDTWQKYQAGLTNGELPDVVQLQDTDTQGAIDTQSILPVQSCINGFHYSTGDLLPRALAYWNVDKAQQAMPFAVSGPVLYYNKLAFQKAGLDPATPPATLADLVTDGQGSEDGGAGGHRTEDRPLVLRDRAGDGEPALRQQRERTVRPGDQGGLRQPDRHPGLQLPRPAGAVRVGGHQLGQRRRRLRQPARRGFRQVLHDHRHLGGARHGGAAAEPVPERAARCGSAADGPADAHRWRAARRQRPVDLQEVVSGQPRRRRGSTSPSSTRPNRRRRGPPAPGTSRCGRPSAQSSTIQNLWSTNPGYKVAYTQLTNGIESPATAGAVLGPFDDVRTAVVNAEDSMFVNGVAPATAVARAQTAADGLITTYNQRIGS